MARRIITLAELATPQIQAMLDKVQIEGKGTCSPPPFDLAAIKARAEKLDAKSQVKADLFMLIIEVERLGE